MGKVLGYDQEKSSALIEQRNKFSVGDRIEIIGPGTDPFQQTVLSMTDADGHLLKSAPHPKQPVIIPVDKPVEKIFSSGSPME